jgi:hypothetical protein
MDAHSAPDVWSEQRKTLTPVSVSISIDARKKIRKAFEELYSTLRRISDMSRCFGVIFSLALAAGYAIGQSSAPHSTVPAASVPSASRPIDLKPDASGAVPMEQIRELLRRAEEKDIENDKQQRDYTYIERVEEHKLDGHGAVKKVESRTSEILQIYGEDVQRLTAKDDKPLPPDEVKKEEDKIQKIIDKHKNESEEDRRKRLTKEEKDHEEDRKFVLEVADAFNFRLIGSEAIGERDAWVLEAEPRPEYEPKSREAKILTKFKGRIWIDKNAEQWVKLDITAIDTISVGFVLARIHKGTHLVMELTRVNDEVWLPKRVQLHFDARLALLKSYDEDVEQTYRDYKKFRADSKITVIGEQP